LGGAAWEWDGMQQPGQFEWLPLQPPPATTAAILQSNNDSTPAPSASASRFSTPAASETSEVVSASFVGPPDLALWRQRLFQSNEGETVALSLEQWQHYWPFMSNVWTKNGTYAPKRKQTVRTFWNCRLYKSKASTSLGEGQRDRHIRQTIACPARLTEVHDTLLDTYTLSIDGRHNHPLSTLDKTKINDGLRVWVETQVL
jgi:hypothetical protein